MKKLLSNAVAFAAAMSMSLGTVAYAAPQGAAIQVRVDGKVVSAKVLEGNDGYYMTLADMASILSGTESGFDVAVDANNKIYQTHRGKTYEADVSIDSEAPVNTPETWTLNIDGAKTQTVSSFERSGEVYFNIGDAGTLYGFGTQYNEANNTLDLTSDKGYPLEIDASNYKTGSVKAFGETVNYKTYTVVYASKPECVAYEVMNIYVPDGATEDSPIFIPLKTGAHMHADINIPFDVDETNINKPSSGTVGTGDMQAAVALMAKGWVVASPAARGYETTVEYDGVTTLAGSAPYCITDFKAAIRYLKHNDAALPGDTDKIVVTGTSGGGTMTSVLGASGNSEFFEPYLAEIGAADETDNVYVAIPYCPVADIDNQGLAYDWVFYGADISNRQGNMRILADSIAKTYVHFLNGLGYKDEDGNALTLDAETLSGTYKELFCAEYAKGFTHYMKTNGYVAEDGNLTTEGTAYFNEKLRSGPEGKGAELAYSAADLFTWHSENGGYATLGLDKYNDMLKVYVARMPFPKGVPSFDNGLLYEGVETPTLDSINKLFNPDKTNVDGWSYFEMNIGKYVAAANAAIGSEYFTPAKGTFDISDEAQKRIAMYNPVYYIKDFSGVAANGLAVNSYADDMLGSSDPAPYWRLRVGSWDHLVSTSSELTFSLALRDCEAVKDIDFMVYWGQPHTGWFDNTEMIEWLTSVPGLGDGVDTIEDFVTALYRGLLSREPDVTGFNAWVKVLKDKSATAAKVVNNFVYSKEFQSKPLDNEEYVTALYNIIFDREPDQASLDAWVGHLNNGATRGKILEGFLNSREMKELADRLGMDAGTHKSTDILDENLKVTAFVARLYRVCLGREFDEGGLRNWTSLIVDGKIKASKAAYGFLMSPEMKAKNLSDNDFLVTLYKALFDRNPDRGGFNMWLDAMEKGMDREEVVNGFLNSKEFQLLCVKYGVEPDFNVEPSTPTVEKEAIDMATFTEALPTNYNTPQVQPLSGYFTQTYDDGRTIKVYMAESVPLRARFTVIAVPNYVSTWDFLKSEGWIDLAEEHGEALFVLEPGKSGAWGSVEDETAYVTEAMATMTSGSNLAKISLFSNHGSVGIAGYDEGCAIIESWAALNPMWVYGQVYMNGKSAGADYLAEAGSLCYDEKLGPSNAPHLSAEQFAKSLAAMGKSEDDVCYRGDIPVPTWFDSYANDDPSITYWKNANDCIADNDKDGVFRQDINSDAWQTQYANDCIRKWNPDARYGLSQVKVSNDAKVSSSDIYNFLAQYTRYTTAWAYSNNLASHMVYDSITKAQRLQTMEGTIAKYDFTDFYGEADFGELRAWQSTRVQFPNCPVGGTLYASAMAVQDYDENGTKDPRQFLVYVPDSVSKFEGKGAPMILVSPGRVQTAETFLECAGFVQIANDEGCVLVYVGQPYTNATSVGYTISGTPKYLGDDPEGANFARALMSFMTKEFDGKYADIDFTRVYASGHSAGSNSSEQLGLISETDWLAAVGSTSFYTRNENFRDGIMPIYLMVGNTDLNDARVDMCIDPYVSKTTNEGATSLNTLYKNIFAKNGMAVPFEDDNYESFLASCSHTELEGTRYTTYSWANNQGIDLVRFGRTLLREHNCYPEEFRCVWDFVSHFKAEKQDDGSVVRYYSASCFEKDDAVKIEKDIETTDIIQITD